EPLKVESRRGGNATLPCSIRMDQSLTPDTNKQTFSVSFQVDVFVAMDYHKRSYGSFHGRVPPITLEDYGRYKCEVIDGLEDGTVFVHSARPPPPRPPLLSPGVVFPYFPRLGRYTSTSTTPSGRAETRTPPWPPSTSCTRRGRGKLDWCNAGWLSDGSVQYPITTPREPCGGKNTVAGGRFYYLIHPSKLTYDEAVRACQQDGAQIAKVGQMYAAWKLLGYDRCDAGWLADGSVRYPVSRPRRRCSPTEAAVRFSGFPDKKHKLYGAYCFKGHN
uniref:Hyaluronan and proteoglycan link protein 1 n=1 Tax=Cyclopterus lumpus TaxID=8103 RepID=A0A8C2WMP0_CYCLU